MEIGLKNIEQLDRELILKKAEINLVVFECLEYGSTYFKYLLEEPNGYIFENVHLFIDDLWEVIEKFHLKEGEKFLKSLNFSYSDFSHLGDLAYLMSYFCTRDEKKLKEAIILNPLF